MESPALKSRISFCSCIKRLSFSKLAEPLQREPWLVASSLDTNYLLFLVPTIFLLLIFRTHPLMAGGFSFSSSIFGHGCYFGKTTINLPLPALIP